MMSIVNEIKGFVATVLKDLYQFDVAKQDLTINSTKPEFEGDYTLVMFGFIKQLKKSPDQLGSEIGDALLKANPAIFTAHNTIKGFLNLTVADTYWLNFLQTNYAVPKFGSSPANGKKVPVAQPCDAQ